MFFVLTLLARTVQFRLAQCIVHKKMTIKIIYTDQTGLGGAGQGSAWQDGVTPCIVEQSNVRQGRAGPRGPGRAIEDRTGSDRTGQGQTGLNSARKVRTGRTGPVRIGQGWAGQCRTRPGRAAPDRVRSIPALRGIVPALRGSISGLRAKGVDTKFRLWNGLRQTPKTTYLKS